MCSICSRRFFSHPKAVVKAGYNQIASDYSAIRTGDSEDVLLLHQIVDRLPKSAVVLDAGCGSGFPVTNVLDQFFHVTGIDFSETQLQLAKQKVPRVNLVCADIAELPFRGDTFDAVCSYYAIIHIPRNEHERVLAGFLNTLRPGGLALLCMGAGDLPIDNSSYHGAPMFWSHYDRDTNLEMIRDIGLRVLSSKIITDPTDPRSAHLFILAQKEGKG